MAIDDKRRYKVAEVSPRHFEQTAKRAGFPASTLQDVMAEVISALPGAAQKTLENLDDTIPDALVDSILTVTRKRAEQIEMYLNS
ncbi:MAG: hypothetical protein AAF862_14940 [Pseudomonadota bacterium]